MVLEVLLSCMNQKDISILEKCNIKTDVLIINQCDNNIYTEYKIDRQLIRMFNSTQRGLSNSRNLALINAKGDICILCDDDVSYKKDYEKKIIEAYKQFPEADIIIFNTEKENYSGANVIIKNTGKAPRYKSYGSVCITFRLKSIQKANIFFNVLFGSGSIYESGEESLWLREARKKGLKVYLYPAVIASVDYSKSTWFRGYNEKFFYDKGAFLAAAYPFLKRIFKYYYVIRLRKKTNISVLEIIKWLNRGMSGYNNLLSFNEFVDNL